MDAADQIQLYKLLARQLASEMDCTASFLPKPLADMPSNGMHTNMSFMKDGKNLFYDADDESKLSDMAKRFVTGILYYADELCLVINSSVNSYRRLDPEHEVANEIKVSSVDRGSMIRIPIANEKSTRVEVRSVAGDCNPYLCMYTLIKAGLAGIDAADDEIKMMEDKVYGKEKRMLPGNIYDAIEYFEKSKFMSEIMGKDASNKYAYLKSKVAERCPRALGRKVKNAEVHYHHEITNKLLWLDF